MARDELKEVYLRLMKAKRAEICQHIDDHGARCQARAISSHTIQRARTLSEIAEAGHVLRITANSSPTPEAPRFRMDRIGIRKASVFPGFCADHDARLFASVETGEGPLTRDDVLLLGYRSICHELYKKEKISFIYSHHEFKSRAQKTGVADLAEAHLHGCKLAIKDLKRLKGLHLRALRDGPDENFHWTVFSFDCVLPLAFSTAFAPEFDFSGRQVLPSENAEWSTVSGFAGNLKGQSVLVLSGISETADHDIAGFFNSLSGVDWDKIGALALHIALEYAENAFFRPSWLNSQLPEVRDEILNRFASGVPGIPNQRKRFLADQFDTVLIGAQRQYGEN